MAARRPKPNTPGVMSGPEIRARLEFADAELLAECKVHVYRASGPGGQHRNKVSSAVRLHHGPSGLIVKATESRLQHENKVRALRRLREAIAISARAPLPAKLSWPPSVQIVERRLHVNQKNPAFFHVLALALDALAAAEGKISDAAACLGVSSSSLSRFLAEHPKAWAEVNRIRRAAGRPPLRS